MPSKKSYRPLYDPELYLRQKYGSKTARDIRSDASVGGNLARMKENPVKALKRRAASKTKKK